MWSYLSTCSYITIFCFITQYIMSQGFSLDTKVYIRRWAKVDLIRQDQLKSEGSPLNRNKDDWDAVFREIQNALPKEDLKDVKRLKRRIDYEKSAIRKAKKALLNNQQITAQPSSTTPAVVASPQPSTNTLPTTQPTKCVLYPMTTNEDINKFLGFNF